MTTLQITEISGGAGIVIPPELLAKLGLQAGDTVKVDETPTGLTLSAYNERVAEQLRVADEVMERRRDVLRRLAE